MTEPETRPAAAFAGMHLIARGPLIEIALAVKDWEERQGEPALVFDAASGRLINLDLRGDRAQIAERLRPPVMPSQKRGRGRPKLGVVAREVTLLPRHWDWLAAQPGGASQALRRLVEQARRADEEPGRKKARQEATYRFMTALAGDLSGYEEALRALFADDLDGFQARISGWPADIRDFALELAGAA